MAKYAVQGSDTLALDLSSIKSGTVSSSTAHKVVVHAADGSVLTFHGNFTGGGGSSFPTGGTITGWSATSDSGSANLSGLSLSVAAFNNFIDANDISGLEQAMFKHNDDFHLSNTVGLTSISGYAGDDVLRFGAKFADDTSALGGAGHDTLVLNGDYAHLEIGAAGLKNVEALRVRGSHNYSITTNDTNIANGATLNVDATDLKATDGFNFDGTDERDGNFEFHLGNLANANVAGGLGNDVFFGGGTGGNTLSGGGGNDRFVVGSHFDGSAKIDGGVGTNTVVLDGNYSEGVTLGPDSLLNIQNVELLRGHNYDLTLDAGNAPDGTTLTIDGHRIGGQSSVHINASAAAGELHFKGGAAADTLIGGSGHNVFSAGHGADSITAGSGHDRFTYHAAGGSTGKGYDTITGFNGNEDHFNLDAGVDKIDTAVTTGKLSDVHFNANMETAVGAGDLGAHDAVLFTASSGTHAGETFLVVDLNGNAGYQAGHDLLIKLDDATHLGAMTSATFV
jgi:hypothetical protein